MFLKIYIIFFLNAVDSKTFPVKIEDTGFSDNALKQFNLKILIPKQMLQRLPIVLAQL